MSTNTPTTPQLIVYGNNYCLLSLAMAAALKHHAIPHEWRDITTGPPEYQAELKALANGYLSVPTVIFDDGTIMVEPFPKQVLDKLMPNRPSLLERLFGR